MCVAVIGEVVGLQPGPGVSISGRVDFGRGPTEPVEMVMVPEVRVGDWVVVHSGYALRVVEPSQVWRGEAVALPDAAGPPGDSAS